MSVTTMPGACLNCHGLLTGPYCASCGQKIATPRPTSRELLHDFACELLQFDGRLWKSLRLLLTRPGFLTREYSAGRRVGYLSPLRLYLIFSLLMFGAAALSPAPTRVSQDSRLGEVVRIGSVNFSGPIRGNLAPEEFSLKVRQILHDWMPRLMLAMVPLWALLVMMVTRGAQRHFPEHMVFALHANAAFYGAWTVDNLAGLASWPALGTAATIAAISCILWYKVTGMRQVYGGSWLLNTGRALVVTVLYLAALMIATGVLLSLFLLN